MSEGWPEPSNRAQSSSRPGGPRDQTATKLTVRVRSSDEPGSSGHRSGNTISTSQRTACPEAARSYPAGVPTRKRVLIWLGAVALIAGRWSRSVPPTTPQQRDTDRDGPRPTGPGRPVRGGQRGAARAGQAGRSRPRRWWSSRRTPAAAGVVGGRAARRRARPATPRGTRCAGGEDDDWHTRLVDHPGRAARRAVERAAVPGRGAHGRRVRAAFRAAWTTRTPKTRADAVADRDDRAVRRLRRPGASVGPLAPFRLPRLRRRGRRTRATGCRSSSAAARTSRCCGHGSR